MEGLIYKGTLVRFKFCFDLPSEEVYMLAEHNEQDENVFQLICVSGYKSGSLGGLVRNDPKVDNAIAITMEHLKSELKRNFLNFESESTKILKQMEVDDFSKPLA